MMRRRQLLQAFAATVLGRVAPSSPACFVAPVADPLPLWDGMIMQSVGVHFFAEPLEWDVNGVVTAVSNPNDWTAPTWEESWANANEMFRGRLR